MTNPIITIFDALTGQVVEREMTAEEAAAHEAIISNTPTLPSTD